MSHVSDCLRELFERAGALTPGALVEEAAAPDHPLHARFEWDDEKAGHQFRLEQARQIIRQVRVERGDLDVRGYVRLINRLPASESDEATVDLAGESYLPVDLVAESPMLRAALLRQMERDWKSLRRKYQDYEEFWRLVQAA